MANNMPFLRIILEANNADRNQDMVDCFTRVLNPIDRDNAGDDLTKIIGYNPITLFDRDDIHKYIDKLIAESSGDLKRTLQTARDKIEELAMSLFNERRPDNLQSCVLDAAEQILPSKFGDEFRARFISQITLEIDESMDDFDEDEFEEEDELYDTEESDDED